MKKITIAIDGYSACGKSTTAKAVAEVLDYTYIDTGAMYRAVTLHFLDNYISFTNKKEVEDALADLEVSFKRNPANGKSEVCLNGLNVEKEIRKMRVTRQVSPVAAIPEVRRAMVAQQQKMGKGKRVVLDGRDIGTVVFPDAELKLFMTADIHIRAERRQQELLEKGQMVPIEEIQENLAERDRIDSTRNEGPLKQAKDAILIDTSFITIEEQVDNIIELVMEKVLETEEV